MTIERLNYLLTGTEQPMGVTEREKTIIKECAKIITDIEQLQQPVVMQGLPYENMADLYNELSGSPTVASEGEEEANMSGGMCGTP
jgi:hypothetical protein